MQMCVNVFISMHVTLQRVKAFLAMKQYIKPEHFVNHVCIKCCCRKCFAENFVLFSPTVEAESPL